MIGSMVSMISIRKVAGTSTVSPDGVVAETRVVACISPSWWIGVLLMAHDSLVLVGSTTACGNDVWLAQLVVASESTMMYFIACIAPALECRDCVTGCTFAVSTTFAGESPTAKHMFDPEDVTAP